MIYKAECKWKIADNNTWFMGLKGMYQDDNLNIYGETREEVNHKVAELLCNLRKGRCWMRFVEGTFGAKYSIEKSMYE